jgi:hypothetical protein
MLQPADRPALEQPGDALRRPHDNCYWLLPGRIIAGEYPRSFDDRSSRAKLAAILGVGVRRFVDLTQEDELAPYDRLLHSEAAVLGATAYYQRYAIRDYGVPTVLRMRAILEAIDAAQDGVVYMHCWGGVGRTGTVAGCLLVEAGYKAEEAIAILARKWTVVAKRDRHPHTPESPEQFEFIRAWRRAEARREPPP